MQICRGEEIYFFKTNSTVSIHSPMHMMLESLENLTLWMAQRCRLSFVGLWKKNIANGKEACQDDQVRQCRYLQWCLVSYLSKELVVFSWAKPLQSLPVDFRLFNCMCIAITLTKILFFDKIIIQFLHRLYSQVNTGQNVEGQSQHPSPQGWKMSYNFF